MADGPDFDEVFADLYRAARRLAIAQQHGGAHDGESRPGLGQQCLLHLPLGARIKGRGVRVGPQARDHHQPLAAVAAGQLGKG